MKNATVAVWALLAGCGAAPPEVDGDEQAVLNGTPIAVTDRLVGLGTVPCGGGISQCTGTLLTNDWVLSAAHCGYACSPPNLTAVYFNGQTIAGARVVNHPSGLDLALIQLSTPVSINGSTTGFQSSLFTGSGDSLIGRVLTVQGFGGNVCGGSPFGVLRQGSQQAYALDQYTISYHPYNSQFQASGDSGGPIWTFFRNRPFQVGVVKAGSCGDGYALRPENFEQWAFEVIYNAPVHVPTTDAQGRGLWAVPSGDTQLWERPLRDNWTQFSPWFTPCPGSSADYIWTAEYNTQASHDYVYVQTDKGFQSLTGIGTTTLAGSGQMRLAYSTDFSVQSQGLSSLTVQCNYGGGPLGSPAPARLVCHGTRCGTTRDPLPNNFNVQAAWDPCNGGDFYYALDYDTELGFDGVTVAGQRYTGRGSVSGVYSAGATSVAVTTDGSVQSHGIRSLKAVCRGW